VKRLEDEVARLKERIELFEKAAILSEVALNNKSCNAHDGWCFNDGHPCSEHSQIADARTELRRVLHQTRISNALITGTSHPEMYKSAKEIELEVEVSRLRDMLKKYGQHQGERCHRASPSIKCVCGLDQALGGGE
jgi:hypothetical protein